MTKTIRSLSKKSQQVKASGATIDGEIIEVPTRFSVYHLIRRLTERKAGFHAHLGPLTAKDEALYTIFFSDFAAGYNDIMRAEYNHRRTYGCKPNWECECPVHQKLASDCTNKLYEILGRVESPENPGKYEPLTSEWWADKGFRLVQPVANPDPVLDWVVLPDGSLPVLSKLHEWAAHWWTSYLVTNLPGALAPDDGNGTLLQMFYHRYVPINWTTELRYKLEDELLKRLKEYVVFKAPPEGLDPIIIACGPWGHDSLIGDACRAAGIDMPVMQREAKMVITPGSISTEQKVFSAL